MQLILCILLNNCSPQIFCLVIQHHIIDQLGIILLALLFLSLGSLHIVDVFRLDLFAILSCAHALG